MSWKLLGNRSILIYTRPKSLRLSSSNATSSSPPEPEPHTSPEPPPETSDEPSALTRRFTAMAEDALTASPHRAADIASENAFSSDLKSALSSRIASASFTSTHASALSLASLPSTAPKHTRDLASTPPWTGTESTPDAVLRMLTDAHKPLPIDLRPSPRTSPRDRLARAKDKSTEYVLSKDPTLTPSERAEIRHLFRERFLPSGRSAGSVGALASLADERIEEARQRGQFDNLPRGKPVERDYNAESPYLDTTEYLLNRIIKKQDIVPPWIEKQQELAAAVRNFRGRLRVEWKRHAARCIAAAGGGVEQQCRRAERYAEEEERGTGEVFRDREWEKTEENYHKLAVENINSITRSYNLMAPELAKKTYYSLERELKNCYRDCAPLIAGEIRERARKPRANIVGGGGVNEGGLLGKLAGETAVIYDSPKPNYGFREFWRDVWGR